MWDIDHQYKRHESTGLEVPFRIEYVIAKSVACCAVLGHPFVLRSVERLQGQDFIPTWDAPRKRSVLEACLRERAATPYGAHEDPFVYRAASGEPLESYRVPHYEYWRAEK